MDIQNAYAQAGITSSIIFVGGVAYKIYRMLNHKRVRCTCCGKKLEASLDIEETTPPNHSKPEVFIDNPIHKEIVSPNGS